MTDTRTLEGLRERLVASTGEHPAVFGAAEVAELLCGLDIAEEIVRAEQVVEWLAGREAYVLLDRDLKWWRYWRIAADKARWGALSKWDEWKGEGGGG